MSTQEWRQFQYREDRNSIQLWENALQIKKYANIQTGHVSVPANKYVGLSNNVKISLTMYSVFDLIIIMTCYSYRVIRKILQKWGMEKYILYNCQFVDFRYIR